MQIQILAWQQIGNYEYEHDGTNYTGRYRCVGGQLQDGTWPIFEQ